MSRGCGDGHRCWCCLLFSPQSWLKLGSFFYFSVACIVVRLRDVLTLCIFVVFLLCKVSKSSTYFGVYAFVLGLQTSSFSCRFFCNRGACLVTRIIFACIACVSHLGLLEEEHGKNHHLHIICLLPSRLPALGGQFWHDVWCPALAWLMQLHGVWLYAWDMIKS